MAMPLSTADWGHTPHLKAEVFYCPQQRTEWTDTRGRERFCAQGAVELFQAMGVINEMMYKGLTWNDIVEDPLPEIVTISKECVVIGTRDSYTSLLGLGDPFRAQPRGSWYFHVFTPVSKRPGSMDRLVFMLGNVLESYRSLQTPALMQQLEELRAEGVGTAFIAR